MHGTCHSQKGSSLMTFHQAGCIAGIPHSDTIGLEEGGATTEGGIPGLGGVSGGFASMFPVV